jgi:hypothetical protein
MDVPENEREREREREEREEDKRLRTNRTLVPARLTPTARSSRDPLSLKETFLISNIRGNYRLTSLFPAGVYCD